MPDAVDHSTSPPPRLYAPVYYAPPALPTVNPAFFKSLPSASHAQGTPASYIFFADSLQLPPHRIEPYKYFTTSGPLEIVIPAKRTRKRKREPSPITMTKPTIKYDEREYKSIESIRKHAGLAKQQMDVLKKAAQEFVQTNAPSCRPTPRLWKKPEWKSLTNNFVDRDANGQRFWNAQRAEYKAADHLVWPQDEEQIKFLAFMTLKGQAEKAFSNSKRTAALKDRDEPAKKQKTEVSDTKTKGKAKAASAGAGKKISKNGEKSNVKSDHSGDDGEGEQASEYESESEDLPDDQTTGQTVQGKKIPIGDPFEEARQEARGDIRDSVRDSWKKKELADKRRSMVANSSNKDSSATDTTTFHGLTVATSKPLTPGTIATKESKQKADTAPPSYEHDFEKDSLPSAQADFNSFCADIDDSAGPDPRKVDRDFVQTGKRSTPSSSIPGSAVTPQPQRQATYSQFTPLNAPAQSTPKSKIASIPHSTPILDITPTVPSSSTKSVMFEVRIRNAPTADDDILISVPMATSFKDFLAKLDKRCKDASVTEALKTAKKCKMWNPETDKYRNFPAFDEDTDQIWKSSLKKLGLAISKGTVDAEEQIPFEIA